MKAQQIQDLHHQYVMPTYAPEFALVRGQGTHVWDADGNDYLDFTAGIAVTNVGHCHPRLVEAIRQQAGRLMHVSNLFYNELQPQLAQALAERSLAGKCFFCNSGAEANEGLIKLARKWGQDRGRYEIITFTNSFHGRTLATLTATGQDKVKAGFAPLPQGFVHAELNDLDSVKAATSERTAAVLIEAVQGEGGVRPADPAFFQALRAWCDEQGLLLLCDEVQCGVGRTGTWWGYETRGAAPDAFSTAKGLGGGFPIGAVIGSPKVADVFTVGSHATTFGGTPLACAAALAVIEVIEEENLLAHATAMGELLRRELAPLADQHDWVEGVRGLGLINGLVLNVPAIDLARALQKKGLLVLATANTVIRLVPPLTVTEAEIRDAAALIGEACSTWQPAREEQQP